MGGEPDDCPHCHLPPASWTPNTDEPLERRLASSTADLDAFAGLATALDGFLPPTFTPIQGVAAEVPALLVALAQIAYVSGRVEVFGGMTRTALLPASVQTSPGFQVPIGRAPGDDA